MTRWQRANLLVGFAFVVLAVGLGVFAWIRGVAWMRSNEEATALMPVVAAVVLVPLALIHGSIAFVIARALGAGRTSQRLQFLALFNLIAFPIATWASWGAYQAFSGHESRRGEEH